MAANTRDILGSQTTLDKLVAFELEDFVDDFVGAIGDDCLRYNTGLSSVVFSGCTGLGQRCLANCSSLESVDIGGVTCTIASDAFYNSAHIRTIVLRGSTVAVLSNVNAFAMTKIPSGYGGIYVPDNLVSSYKTATNWSAFADSIYPISEYPRTDYSSISDTWEQIFEAEANGTYVNKYHVGDTKAVEVNGITMYMKIAAFDADVLSDNSGNAKITWICRNVFASSKTMNNAATTSGGWASCSLRAWLANSILPTIPALVRNNIKEVEKTYYDYGSSQTLTASDRIWIPSSREVCLTGAYLKETSGAQYTELFPNNISRTRFTTDSRQQSYYWLRSASDTSNFVAVGSNTGSPGTSNASYGSYVLFGFCT